jgi:hypothetical protein
LVFHHQFNLVRGSVLTSSGSNTLPNAVAKINILFGQEIEIKFIVSLDAKRFF